MKIEVIARPSGQAPEWVRDAWIGIQLEAKRDNPEGTIYLGVLGGKASQDNIGGYRVNGGKAMKVLTDKNPKAAQWWNDNASFVFLGDLVFGAKFCKVIEP